MAKSKNHTAHNQTYKAHKRGIQKVKATKYQSTKGVSDAVNLVYLAFTSWGSTVDFRCNCGLLCCRWTQSS